MTLEIEDKFVFTPPFGSETIKKIIPHRHPFLMVDRILDFNETGVTGVKNLSDSDPVFQGHFPGEPVYPGVLQIEVLAQVGACWMLAHKEHFGKIAYLLSVESAKFRRMAIPGMQLIVRADMTSLKGRIGRLDGKIYSDDQLISEAKILFAFQKKENGENARG